MRPKGSNAQRKRSTPGAMPKLIKSDKESYSCLLYTSDAADERSSVDLGGRRIIKKKKKIDHGGDRSDKKKTTKNRTYMKQVRRETE